MMNKRKISQGILFLVLFIYFIIFLYDDMVVTYTHSIHFLECVFSGRFLDFYKYTLEHKISGYAADYYLPIYILFGIWNLPMWLFTKAIGMPLQTLSLLWCKMILLPFYVCCVWIVKKILIYLGFKKIEFSLYNTFSSLCLLIPVFATAQYDIISLTLILFGIFISIKKDNISNGVVFIFAVAITFKLFALFPYILLVLLKEKNIWKIIKKVILGFSGIVFFSLPFLNQPEYFVAMSTNGGWLQRLAASTIPGGLEDISIFVFCFMILCFIAYNTYTEKNIDYVKWIMWLNSAFWVCFFVFVEAHPYWSVFLSVFLGINISLQKNSVNLCVLLNMVVNTCLLLVQGYSFNWVYFCDTTNLLMLKYIKHKNNIFGIETLADIIIKMKMQDVIPIIFTVFVFAAVALIYITYPAQKTINKKDDVSISVENIYIINTIFIVVYLISTLLIVYVI